MAEPRRAVVKTAKPPTTVVRVGKPEPRRAEPSKKVSTAVVARPSGRGPRRAVLGGAAASVKEYAAKLGERLGTGSTTTLFTPWWLTEFDSQVGGVSPILQNGTAVANASVAAVQAAFTTIYPGSSLPLVQQSSGPIPSPNMTSSQVLAYIAAQATADAAAYSAHGARTRALIPAALAAGITVNGRAVDPAAAPTVALGAGNAATGISGTTRTLWSSYAASKGQFVAQAAVAPDTIDPTIAYTGATAKIGAIAATGSYTGGVLNGNNHSTNPEHGITATVQHDGLSIDIIMWNPTNYRVVADGVTVVDWTAGWSDGTIKRLNLLWGTATPRRITVEIDQGSLAGFTYLLGDGLSYPQIPNLPRIALLADSVGQGQNDMSTPGNPSATPNRMRAFPRYLGQLMGWDVHEYAEGGTGFLNPNSGGVGTTTYHDRLTYVAAAAAAGGFTYDGVMFCGGLNDELPVNAAYTAAALTAAVQATLAQATALLPGAAQYVVGPFYPGDATQMPGTGANSGFAIDAVRAAIIAGVGGVPFVDTRPWFINQGGGYGSTGYSNTVITPDVVHPNTPRGHRFYANSIARDLMAATTFAAMP